MDMNIPGLETEEPTPPQRKGLTPGTIVLMLGIIVVVAVIGIQLARRNAMQPTSGIAPNFSMPLYGDGGDFNLSDQRGSIVVLNFWGSWCVPCREEAPFLESVHQRYADEGVVVVGVNFRDTESAALDFLDEFDITYPNGIDIGEHITSEYNVTGAPETFVIDRNGEIHQFFWGEVDETDLVPVLDELLRKGA
jgi:cytochrome c biogenesis protein CcmG, thiol:disulfide interchange protein DsbE